MPLINANVASAVADVLVALELNDDGETVNLSRALNTKVADIGKRAGRPPSRKSAAPAPPNGLRAVVGRAGRNWVAVANVWTLPEKRQIARSFLPLTKRRGVILSGFLLKPDKEHTY